MHRDMIDVLDRLSLAQLFSLRERLWTEIRAFIEFWVRVPLQHRVEGRAGQTARGCALQTRLKAHEERQELLAGALAEIQRREAMVKG